MKKAIETFAKIIEQNYTQVRDDIFLIAVDVN